MLGPEAAVAASSLVAQAPPGPFLWGSCQAGLAGVGSSRVQSVAHSSDCSMSSCFSTFVWLVSRISPARNISSTTV